MERGRAVSAIYRSARTAPRIFETQDEGQRQPMHGFAISKTGTGEAVRIETLEREMC
jgi:hypothetical protein